MSAAPHLAGRPHALLRLVTVIVSLNLCNIYILTPNSSTDNIADSDPMPNKKKSRLILTPNRSTDDIAEPHPKPNNKKSPRRVYWCGYGNFFEDGPLNHTEGLFPETPSLRYDNHTNATVDDVLLRSQDGPCPYENPTLVDRFPGKLLYMKGESTPGYPIVNERTFSFGHQDSKQEVKASFGAMHLATLPLSTQERIYNPDKRAQNTKKHFLLYLAFRCNTFRNKAFDMLSRIGPVHHGSKCRGSHFSPNKTKVTFAQSFGWAANDKVFEDYRFGLVLENKLVDGYITEKIFNAFLSGTVPIWYGTTEIFKVFNHRAFIYYDIKNPQPALERVAYLESNRTAYEEVLNEPILANGSQTVQDYFSFRDEVGGGKLKWRIREMMGYV